MVGPGRAKLRWLIDALEARYSSLPEDTSTLQNAADGQNAPGDVEATTPTVSEVDEQFADGLGELLSIVRAEVATRKARALRLLNLEQRAVNLPVELLSKIFEAVCFADVHARVSHHGLGGSSRKALCSLCSTCSRWREIAMKTSVLWSHISYEPKHGLRPEWLATQLSRAGRRPLRVYLYSEWLVDRESPLISTIREVASVSRFYDVIRVDEINTNETSDLPLLYNAPGTSHLRCLIINWFFEAVETEPPSPQPINIVNSHSLTHLWLLFYDYGQNLTWLINHPPVCKITHLQLDGHIEISSVISLIRACPELAMLDWTCWMLGEEHSALLAACPCIKLPDSLEELSLGGPFPLRIMKKFEAAGIVHLRLITDTGDFTERDEQHQAIWDTGDHPFSNPSIFPQIRTFETDAFLGRGYLPPFLAAHKSLEKISLRLELDSGLDICLAPIPGSTSGYLLPKLRNVYAECERESALEYVEGILRLRKQHDGENSHPFTISLDLEPMDDDLEDPLGAIERIKELSRVYPGSIETRAGPTTFGAWDWCEEW